MENTNSIKDIISNSLEQVRTVLNADTVVGQQIYTESGTVIIPISKVSMGFASGGLDLPTKSAGSKNFGGGGGTGVTVSPIGFLTVFPDGRVEMLPITAEPATPLGQILDLVEQAPSIIARIKAAISGKGDENEEIELINLEDKIAEELAQKATENVPLTKKEQRELKKLQKEQAKGQKKVRKDPFDALEEFDL